MPLVDRAPSPRDGIEPEGAEHRRARSWEGGPVRVSRTGGASEPRCFGWRTKMRLTTTGAESPSSQLRSQAALEDLREDAARGPVAAHAVHAAAGRGGRRAEEDVGRRRRVGIE